MAEFKICRLTKFSKLKIILAYNYFLLLIFVKKHRGTWVRYFKQGKVSNNIPYICVSSTYGNLISNTH